MRVPITLANGHAGHLFIRQRQANAAQAVYVQDEHGLHPIQLGNNVSRADLTQSPAIVGSRAAAPRANKRSWEKEALIIGGSAGAGTAIGALAGGKKGAGILRTKPNIKWEKDRGNEPKRDNSDFPWFWKDGAFTGERLNDVHLKNEEKQQARTA